MPSLEVIYITDLVRGEFPPIIEGRVFEQKEIRGPAVLCPLDPNCGFVECSFLGQPEAVFLSVSNKEMVGIIGVISVRFVRCRLNGIGLVVTPPESQPRGPIAVDLTDSTDSLISGCTFAGFQTAVLAERADRLTVEDSTAIAPRRRRDE